MAEERDDTTAQVNIAAEVEHNTVTSLMFESVDSLQIYLSKINDELSELKRFKSWALPILHKLTSTESCDGIPSIRSALQVKRESECRSGTETLVLTPEVVGTPGKVENRIRRHSDNKTDS